MFQIGTRFENTFGDSYYRVVVEGFYPSRRTLIVRTAVLVSRMTRDRC
jgi:hypothetical protein